jgi:S-DNA-T family DNA segregation ATPase FtsK/SpoIIIE
VPLFAPRRTPAIATGPAVADAAPGSAPRRTLRTYAREAAALLLLASSLYWMLALSSFQGDPLRPEVFGDDWVGPVGAVVAGQTIGLFGLLAWLVPTELAALALPLLADRPSGFGIPRLAGNVVIAVVLSALVHVAFPETLAFGAMPVGGAVGELFGELMRGLFSAVGSYIVGLTVVGLILVARATFSFIDSAQAFAAWLGRVSDRLGALFAKLGAAWEKARAIDAARSESNLGEDPIITRPSEADALVAALSDMDGARDTAPPLLELHSAIVHESAPQPANDTPAPAPVLRAALPRLATPRPPLTFDLTDVPTPSPLAPVAARVALAPLPELEDEPITPAAEPSEPAPKSRAKAPRAPRIVDTSHALETQKAEAPARPADPATRFRLPSVELLDPAGDERVVVDEERLKRNAELLEKTLADYGVSGKVEEIHPGPTVTTFEVSPAAGTKVSKIAGLADDLALGLSRKVRIVAPIPGKNRVGFEIPNEQRQPVNLRELIEDRRFQEMKAPLPCVLGRDIVGAPCFADLSSMPHVIVAGATGAGKSVGLNVMLVSLLCRRTPEELRLLMVDPKVVELAPFDRIPHMLLPVVTDMKQAANALKWAVDEMERRYQLFANAGTRNIGSYNGWVERVLRGEAKPPKGPAKVMAAAPDGSEVELDAAKDGSDFELPEKLPYIVIVVDEFADLMMQQGKDVEASVARLAQKARAAGMHVILATQRPSVDVITGMIKANFPTRIAFRVAQKVDSRTILDEQGAEHLLGKGDMLVKLNGSNDTKRVQCPFSSEEEVQRITDFLRSQGEPVYDEAILRPRDDEGEAESGEDAEQDPLYDAGVRIVADTRRCSTSWLQRKLGVGYNRAAKIVETMEKRGLVGPANGAKDREVLIAPI